MGHQELLAALQQEGEEQAKAIRRAAAEAEDALRAEIAGRRNALRGEQEQRLIMARAARQREILAAAAQEAALIRLRAEHELALRLRERATACLELLRDEGYGELFRELVQELPACAWATVRVNPVDRELATDCFPNAAIVTDPTITGGLVAASADDSLTVVNTLESRLERCWPDLLPGLMTELRGRTA